MNYIAFLESSLALIPFGLMMISLATIRLLKGNSPKIWSVLLKLSLLASLTASFSLGLQLSQSTEYGAYSQIMPGLGIGLMGAWFTLLIQGLGTIITAFSQRYLEGEPGQERYVAALSAVLAAVQLLVVADHWIILIGAWVGTGFALQRLLCFYNDRPFAVLAAHKKFLADRLADVFLVCAACIATNEVGSGSISVLLHHVVVHGASNYMQICAALLVLAVAIRTAMLPVHGWLIQVMEAPTPVSALLHAGVVNLGGYVMIRFSPLLELVTTAQTLLVVVGLSTAILAGFVMLTRISIKVRLAWSTLAQMGFMVLECGLGLYQLAALHLIGHSLYKAHAFLSAGETVRSMRFSEMRGTWRPLPWNMLLAPVLSSALVFTISSFATGLMRMHWPWWWNAVLAMAWAPILWIRVDRMRFTVVSQRLLHGCFLVVLMTVLAYVGHALPMGVSTFPHGVHGQFTLAAMILVYFGTAAMQMSEWKHLLEPLRRQSYAGFYLDEAYTRLALHFWPVKLPTNYQPLDAKPKVAVARVQKLLLP